MDQIENKNNIMETGLLKDQQTYDKIIERIKLFEQGANDKISKDYSYRSYYKAVFSPVKTISLGHYGGDALRIEFQKVSEKYPEVTDVLGDGNCFYRSFMFSFFLSLFSHESCTQQERAQRIIKLILEVEDIKFDQDISLYAPHGRMHYQEAKDFFIMFIYNQFSSRQRFLPADFREFYASNYFFDCSSVIICRLKIYKEFQKNIYNPKLSFFLDSDKRRDIPELLLRYGSQAEDVILQLSAQAFDTKLKIQSCYSQYPKIVQHEVEVNPFYKQGTVNVALFYTGGHYMALCDYSLKNNPIDDPINEIENINGKNDNNNIHDHQEENNQQLNNNNAAPMNEIDENINGKNNIPHPEVNYNLNSHIGVPKKQEIENADGKNIILDREEGLKLNNDIAAPKQIENINGQNNIPQHKEESQLNYDIAAPKLIENINGQNNIPQHKEEGQLNYDIAAPKLIENINGQNNIPQHKEELQLNNDIAAPKQIENNNGQNNIPAQEEDYELINSNTNNNCEQDKNAEYLLVISSNEPEKQVEKQILEFGDSMIDEDSNLSSIMISYNSYYDKARNKNEQKMSKDLENDHDHDDDDKKKQKAQEESIQQTNMYESKSTIFVPSGTSKIFTQEDFEKQTFEPFQISAFSQKACLSCNSNEPINEFELGQNLKGYLCQRCIDSYGIVSSMKFFSVHSSSLGKDYILHNTQ